MGPEEKREGRVFNRIVRVSEDGWEYEADQRHADLIIKGSNMTEAKSAKTPGEETKKDQEDEDAEELNKNGGKEFRGLAARANYLSAARGDIQHAVKELCRGMAAPTRGECKKIRRLARYLIGRPRVVMHCLFQRPGQEVSGYSDSDWAGCRRTAKSTSGGAIMRGSHCLTTWSSTQRSVSLSSAKQS